MTVGELMSQYIVRVSYDESAFRAAELMRRNKIGVLPVVRGNSIVGVITDRDIVTRCIALGKKPIETSVDRIMTQPAISIETVAPVTEAAALMARHQIKRVPVTRNGALVGMVSLCDLPRAMPSELVAGAYRDIFTCGPSDAKQTFLDTLFS